MERGSINYKLGSGKYVVSCSGDTQDMFIKVWDGNKLQNLSSFLYKDPSEGLCEVLCARFCPTKDNIVAACSNDSIYFVFLVFVFILSVFILLALI